VIALFALAQQQQHGMMLMNMHAICGELDFLSMIVYNLFA